MPKVSIIVPVYNVEKYIRNCLDSIRNQTFTDWECILVDDGSTDTSGTICNEYAKIDSRFKVFHEENGGVSSARNLGISQAVGEWTYFCDSDDEVLKAGIQTLVDGISDDVDLIIAGYVVENENGSFIRKVPEHSTEIIDKDEMVKRLIYSSEYIYQGNVWSKLFRADIIHDKEISYDEDVFFNEDRLFIMKYLCRSRGSVYFSTTPVYKYIERANGAMGSLKIGYNPKFVTDLKATLLMLEEVRCAHCSNENIRRWKTAAILSYKWVLKHAKDFGYNDKKLFSGLKKELLSQIGKPFYVFYTMRSFLGRIKSKILL